MKGVNSTIEVTVNIFTKVANIFTVERFVQVTLVMADNVLRDTQKHANLDRHANTNKVVCISISMKIKIK